MIIILLIVIVICSFIYTKDYEGYTGLTGTDGVTGPPNSEGFDIGVTGLQYLQDGYESEIIGLSGSGITGVIIEPVYNTSDTYNYNHYTKVNNSIVFYGSNNNTAVVSNEQGNLMIILYYGNGNKETYKYSQTYDEQIIFKGPNSNTATMTKVKDSMTLTIYANGKTLTFYSNLYENKNKLAGYLNEYYYGDSQESSTPSQPPIETHSFQPSPNKYDYSSYLPNGIPKSAIPYGKEDLYILKSEVVPPVCPVCPPPVVIMGDGSSKGLNTPPCPACERCPEPIVDCKKVIKYKQNTGSNYGNTSNSSNNSTSNSSSNSNNNSNSNGSNSNSNTKTYSGFNSDSSLYKQGKYTPKSESTPVPLLNSFSAFGI